MNNIMWKKALVCNDYTYTNPLWWEFFHILYFAHSRFEANELGNLYDSFLCHKNYRLKGFRSFHILFKYINFIEKLINKIPNDFTKHAILMHFHMHFESILFTLKFHNCVIEKIPKNISENTSWIPETIYFSSDTFIQGCTDIFGWDNEKPPFLQKVEPFYLCKYPVTYELYTNFIKENGYKEKKWWSTQGWRSCKKYKWNHPLHFEIHKHCKNMPVCHISWYEAEAFCNWFSSKTDKIWRIPKEHEWEYACKTLKCDRKYANLGYQTGLVSVFEYDNIQMFGNVWEWCQEEIYPYDGYCIDPIYREMSFPYFGHKKICRGGSWACPRKLINSSYRNAQMPDNQVQFTGLRMVYH